MCQLFTIYYQCPLTACGYIGATVYGTHCQYTQKDNVKAKDQCPGDDGSIRPFRVKGPCPVCSGVKDPNRAGEVVRQDGSRYWKRFTNSGSTRRMTDRDQLTHECKRAILSWEKDPDKSEDEDTGPNIREGLTDENWADWKKESDRIYDNTERLDVGEVYSLDPLPWGKSRPQGAPRVPHGESEIEDIDLIPPPATTSGDDGAKSPDRNGFVYPPKCIYEPGPMPPRMHRAIEMYLNFGVAPTQPNTGGHVLAPQGQAISAYGTPIQSGYMGSSSGQTQAHGSGSPSQDQASSSVNPFVNPSMEDEVERWFGERVDHWVRRLMEEEPGLFDPAYLEATLNSSIQSSQAGSSNASLSPAPRSQAGGGFPAERPPNQAGASGYAYDAAAGQDSMPPPPRLSGSRKNASSFVVNADKHSRAAAPSTTAPKPASATDESL